MDFVDASAYRRQLVGFGLILVSSHAMREIL